MITQDFQITVTAIKKTKKQKFTESFYFSVSGYNFAQLTEECSRFYNQFKDQWLADHFKKFSNVKFELWNI